MTLELAVLGVALVMLVMFTIVMAAILKQYSDSEATWRILWMIHRELRMLNGKSEDEKPEVDEYE